MIAEKNHQAAAAAHVALQQFDGRVAHPIHVGQQNHMKTAEIRTLQFRFLHDHHFIAGEDFAFGSQRGAQKTHFIVKGVRRRFAVDDEHTNRRGHVGGHIAHVVHGQ